MKMTSAARWLGDIILSEVRQKGKYHLYAESIKNGTHELIYKVEKLTDIDNEFMVTRGQRLEGGITWKFGIDMYTRLNLK